jgi:hypothetical protein
MVEGTIRSIDHASRMAVVQMRDGREVSVHIPVNAHIEVNEPASGGMQGGTLEDLSVGYLVNLEIHEHGNGAACHCMNLVCIS